MTNVSLNPKPARVSVPLTTAVWDFLATDGASPPDFSASGWTPVTMPHTWNAVDGTHGGDLEGRNRTGYRRGPAWYRRTFVLGTEVGDRRFFLRFEGASQTSSVFLNGWPVGDHTGAFTAFCFEITDHVVPDDNLLLVRVDNTWHEDIPPLEGDFVVFGGLYRPVHLITTGAVCISPLHYAGPGVYATAHDITPATATLKVRTLLSDRRTRGEPCTVRVRLLDADRCQVAEVSLAVAAPVSEAVQTLTIVHPRLWTGLRDPYLYRIRVEILAHETIVDDLEVPFGFRFFAFDSTGAFLLNGTPYRIAGVNRHQDREGRGWALTAADHEEDIALIRDLGANAVRLAHYPQSDFFYELCDRAGLLVWAEISLVNVISNSTAFAQNIRRQLAELIHQQFNRTGIFTWGLWNELGMSDGPDPEPLVRSLHELARTTDPTRPTVAAGFAQTLQRHPAIIGHTDLVAWNEYPGWYGAQPPADLGKIIDRLHALVPNRGLAISEYGAGASIRHHTQNLKEAPPAKGRWHPEEWQAFVHEETWREIARRPAVWGSFVWNLCDFASARLAEGDRDGINDKGLVTFDRRIRKDAFYFYRAVWSSEPTIHLASRRHTIRTRATTPVKVYANIGPVALHLNGELQPGPETDGVIHHWPSVELRPGDNLVEVSAVAATGRVLTDHCRWHLETEAP